MIGPKTWKFVNDELARYAKDKKVENGRYIRADTSVAETDIAYPIDARLLNDSVRVLTRLMKRIREAAPGMHFSFHDRTRSAKRQCYRIVMTKGKNAKKKRKNLYKKLLAVSNGVFATACKCLKERETCQVLEAAVCYDELERFVELAAVAIDQCERRVLKDEKVPANEKIVSIFEDHTDIIMRGKSQCPTEFGHNISVVTDKSGIITQYDIFKGNPSDDSTLEKILDDHVRQYEKPPWHFSAGSRYYSVKNEELLQKKASKRCPSKSRATGLPTGKALKNSRGSKSCKNFRRESKASFRD